MSNDTHTPRPERNPDLTSSQLSSFLDDSDPSGDCPVFIEDDEGNIRGITVVVHTRIDGSGYFTIEPIGGW